MIARYELNMTKLLLWLILLTLTVVLWSSPLYGQVQNRVEQDLERTERIIVEAKQLVSESGNPRSAGYVERAVFLQDKAWSYFHNGNYKLAEEFTFMARTHAQKAVGLIRSGQDNQSLVEREIEKTDDMISKVRDQIGVAFSPTISKMLENAELAQNKARELFHQNRQKLALTATLRARDFIEKGIETAHQSNQAEREIEKTNMLIDRARDLLAELQIEDPPAFYANALRLQEKAREFHNNGNYKLAIEQTVRARRQILDALERLQKEIQSSNFPQVLARIEAKYDGLVTEATGNESAINYLNRAVEFMEKGKQAYGEDQIEAAMYYLRQANRSLNEASEYLQ